MSRASQAIRRVSTKRIKTPSASESLFKRFTLKTTNEISKTGSTMKPTEAPVMTESQSSPGLYLEPENQLSSPVQSITEPISKPSFHPSTNPQIFKICSRWILNPPQKENHKVTRRSLFSPRGLPLSVWVISRQLDLIFLRSP